MQIILYFWWTDKMKCFWFNCCPIGVYVVLACSLSAIITLHHTVISSILCFSSLHSPLCHTLNNDFPISSILSILVYHTHFLAVKLPVFPPVSLLLSVISVLFGLFLSPGNLDLCKVWWFLKLKTELKCLEWSRLELQCNLFVRGYSL